MLYDIPPVLLRALFTSIWAIVVWLWNNCAFATVLVQVCIRVCVCVFVCLCMCATIMNSHELCVNQSANQKKRRNRTRERYTFAMKQLVEIFFLLFLNFRIYFLSFSLVARLDLNFQWIQWNPDTETHSISMSNACKMIRDRNDSIKQKRCTKWYQVNLFWRFINENAYKN